MPGEIILMAGLCLAMLLIAGVWAFIEKAAEGRPRDHNGNILYDD